MPSRRFLPLVLITAALSLAAPALAQDAPPPSVPPPMPPMSAAEMEAPIAAPQGYPGTEQAAYERARADWLAECRHRHGSGATVGGTVVGGVLGGLVGNRVAGRGHRTEGTLVGAAIGAVAGGALGARADQHEARDYCEAYLDRHTGYGGYGYPGYGQAYAMQPMMVMVPVAAAAKPRECEETVVTEEWVDVPARRVVPSRPRPSKRVPVTPDKRVHVN